MKTHDVKTCADLSGPEGSVCFAALRISDVSWRGHSVGTCLRTRRPARPNHLPKTLMGGSPPIDKLLLPGAAESAADSSDSGFSDPISHKTPHHLLPGPRPGVSSLDSVGNGTPARPAWARGRPHTR